MKILIEKKWQSKTVINNYNNDSDYDNHRTTCYDNANIETIEFFHMFKHHDCYHSKWNDVNIKKKVRIQHEDDD